jgi:hypothetical protein
MGLASSQTLGGLTPATQWPLHPVSSPTLWAPHVLPLPSNCVCASQTTTVCPMVVGLQDLGSQVQPADLPAPVLHLPVLPGGAVPHRQPAHYPAAR